MKKNSYLLFSLLILLSMVFLFAPAFEALADDLPIEGEACILLDGSTGQVLYEKNSDKKWFPASVTKIMTLVLVLEAVDRGDIALTDMVSTSEEAASMGGSQVYLFPGEKRTLNEMLIGAAVGSGNDACVAMAEHVAGSLPAFVDLMNKRAKELAMTGTHFANPHGLHDPNHYTTAKDLSILALHALKVPHFLEYTSIYEYDFRPEPKPLKLWNTNRLLKWYDGCDGMKTGYTAPAKRNLVATAQRDGLRLVSVVLGVEPVKGHFTESMKLLNYGFNKYTYQSLYKASDSVGKCAVSKGKTDQVDLMVQENIGFLKEKSTQGEYTSTIYADPFLPAPVKKGDKAGELLVFLDGKEMAAYPLVAANDVPKGSAWRIWGKMMQNMGIYL